MFRTLGQNEVSRIVDLQLTGVASLASEAGVELDVSGTARKFLAVAGFDPVFGARL